MAPLVRLLPPSYSAPSTSQPRLPANAHASSSTSRSSSKPRAPRLARQDSTFGDDEDYLHWAPSPPFVEGSKLPSSVTISYPPQDLLVLLAPPKVDPLGEEDWSGIDEGRDSCLAAVITIVSPKRKVYHGLRVDLVGTQRLSFAPDGGSGMEETELFRRELELDGPEDGAGDFVLEKGENLFKLRIRVPASAALSDRCKNGKIEYSSTATLLGSGSVFRGDVSSTKTVWVVSDPSNEDRLLQFQEHQEGISSLLGPFSLELVSTEFLVGAPLSITLNLAFPPPTLTIFALHCSIQQTTFLQSRTQGGKIFEVKGPKQKIFSVGPRDGYTVAGFAERARKKGKLVFDGASGAGRDATGGWILKEMGRLPDDNAIRPTTVPGTKTDLRFTSELSVDMILSEGDATLKVLTLLRQDVFLTSCICVLDRISLPSYSPDHPEQENPIERPICRCVEKWETLRQSELKAMAKEDRGTDGWVEEEVEEAGGARNEKGGERVGRWGGVGTGRTTTRRKIGETYRTR